MSASASQSNPQTTTTNTQLSQQGASGANSPTITSQGNVNYNDPALQLSTVQALQQVVEDALSGAGSSASQALTVAGNAANNSANQVAAQSASEQEILQEALSAQQALSTYQGTGGAVNTVQTTSNNYLIFGAIGIALLAVFGMFFSGRKAA